MNKSFNFPVEFVGRTNDEFKADLSIAIFKLDSFLEAEGWSGLDQSLIKKVIHYETKELYDNEIIRMENGKLSKIPLTYIALGEGGELKVVSWKSYKNIFPDDKKDDYINVLVHEMAHIFHSHLVGDDRMGPVWFFEGFAIVAASQYLSSPKLNLHQKKNILAEKSRGSYNEYSSLMRDLLKKHPIKRLMERVANGQFDFVEVE